MASKNSIDICRLPEYEVPFSIFLHNSTNKYSMIILTSYIPLSQNKVNYVDVETNLTTKTEITEGVYHEVPSIILPMPFKFTKDEVISTDMKSLYEKIVFIAKTHAEKMIEKMVNDISELCKATGNLIDGSNIQDSFELFCQLIEKIDMEFDEDGEVIWNHILISGNQKVKKQFYNFMQKKGLTKEQLLKLNELYDRKRDVYNASKRIRRLL